MPPTGPASLRRNALANMAGRLASAVIWVAVTPFVLARFGQERFAVWSLFFVLSGYVATLDLGMSSGLARFVALGVARGSRRAVRRAVLRSLAVSIAMGLLAALLAVLLRGLFLRAFHVPPALAPEVERSLLVFALLLIAFSVTQVLQGTLAGFQRLDLQNLCFVAGLTLHTALLVLVLARGGGLVGAVAAILAGHLLAGLLALRGFSRCLRTLPPGGDDATPTWRELVGFGLSVQATNALAAGQLQAAKLLVGVLGRLVWVTQFELGFRVANTVWSLPVLVLGAVIPASAHASEAGGEDALREIYSWASRWVFALAGVALAGVWLTAGPLMTLWLGAGHPQATAVARGLAAAFAVATVFSPAGAVARGGGWPWLESRTYGVALVLNVATALVLVPRMGVTGAAWSMALSYAAAGAWLVASLHRRLAIPTGAWLARTVAPRLLPPFVVAGVLFWTLGTHLPESRGSALRLLALEGGLFMVAAAWFSWLTGDAGAVMTMARHRLAGGAPATAAGRTMPWV